MEEQTLILLGRCLERIDRIEKLSHEHAGPLVLWDDLRRNLQDVFAQINKLQEWQVANQYLIERLKP